MERAQINGAELAYEQRGKGAPVLLIHGTGAYTAVWGDIPKRLAEHNLVIAYDRRGFGESGGPRAESLGDHAEDAAALLDYLDVGPATVVGWSAGGTIATMLAVGHPDKVASLVLSEPALHLSTHLNLPTLRMTIGSRIAESVRRDCSAAAATMYRWHTPAGTEATTFDEYPAEWRAQMIDHADVTLCEMKQQTTPTPRREQLASIGCPVTIMIGDRSDLIFPRIGRFLLKARPETKWVDLPGAGHTPHLDCPELWVRTIAEAAEAAPSPTPAAA